MSGGSFRVDTLGENSYTMSMILNPPLRIGSVEVTSVNAQVHSIHLMVHIKATPADAQTLQTQVWISEQIRNACKYLVSEGYITGDINSWLTHIAAVLHNP